MPSQYRTEAAVPQHGGHPARAIAVWLNLVAVLLLTGCTGVLGWLFRNYVTAVNSLAEQTQIVGDVGGTAAELAAQGRHQERHIEHVDLVRQDVFAKTPLEHHDVVVGD